MRTLGCWEATCCWCPSIGFQRVPTLGVLQASTPKAAVFQVSKPCSSLSRIQITLQQSFRYPNLAAVFQVSKPCNSLSGIQIKPCSSLTLRNQTLQQPNSFTYPNLAVVFQIPKPYRQQPKRLSSSSPNRWLQAVLHKEHSLWYSVYSLLDGGLFSEFPTLYKQV